MPLHPAPDRDRTWPGIVVGLAAFGYLISYPPTLGASDESCLLYGAKRLLEGQALYRDFFEFITPAAFYLYAIAYRIGGVSITTARIVSATVNATSCGLLFLLARRVAGPAEALLVVVLFVAGCVPVWHVASPHWLSTALCLATAATLVGGRARGPTRTRSIVAGALAGLTFACQQHRGVWLGLWLAVAVAVLAGLEVERARARNVTRALVWIAIGWFAAAGPVLGYAVYRASLREIYDATFVFVMQHYRSSLVGTVRWGGCTMFACWGAESAWAWLPVAIPTVVVLAIPGMVRRLRSRQGEDRGLQLVLLLLVAAMAGAVAYYPDYIHLAFIAPFPFVVAAGLLGDLRRWPWRGAGGRARAVGLLAIAAGCVFGIVKAHRNLIQARQANPVRVMTAFGELASSEFIQGRFDRIDGVVRQVPESERTLFSYMSDAWLYLALSARNPTPFSLLIPGYSSARQFQAAIQALEQSAARFLVVNQLGIEPGDRMTSYARLRYERVLQVPPYELYVRRGAPP